jgi:hypothetical protein
MPSLLIKINEPKNSETLILDHVRPGYVFRYEDAHKAYVYRPKNQAEVDEIFSAQRVYRSVWTFIPVIVPDGAKEPVAPPIAAEVKHGEALQAEVDRLTGLLAAAQKRIADLNTGLATLKGEYDKALSAAAAALDTKPTPAPAKEKKPHWKTAAKAAAEVAKKTAQPAAAPAASPEPAPVADDIPPAE